MRPIPNTDFPTYSDHVYTVALPLSLKRCPSRLPATVILEPRPSWQENKSAVIRYHLTRLNCEQVTQVYGVHIQRTDAFARITFHINADCNANGTFTRYELVDAVARVLAIVEAS